VTGDTVVADSFKARIAKVQKRLFAWARIIDEWSRYRDIDLISVGLSYAKIEDWKKGHIQDFLNRVVGALDKRLLGWCWVLELQKRGALHYDVLLAVEKGTRIDMPDKSGMWQHGSTNIQGCKVKKVFYLVRYEGKERQKDYDKYPKSARTYGISLRMAPERVRDEYRAISGIEKQSGEKWEFRGSAVNKSYAENVLAKRL
jgi:hypothetical protein